MTAYLCFAQLKHCRDVLKMCIGICSSGITCWAYRFKARKNSLIPGLVNFGMKCVILGGVINIGISSIGSICKQWKGYLVASGRTWMLAWGWQPPCIHTTQTEVRVEVWLYCDGNVASRGFWGAIYGTASVWILLFLQGAADTTSAGHKRSAALKVFFYFRSQTNTVFFQSVLFFFHLSILKRFCYISRIQKKSPRRQKSRRRC